MSARDEKLDLDFTMHFGVKAVMAETVPAVPVPEKLVLDPKFRIGVAKLEVDGFFVSVARRATAARLPEVCKVMIVEDEPVTRAVLQKVLSTDGFHAYAAVDAAGLGMLLKAHGLPHLIMLDIELPKASGLQILARIRKHPRMEKIPVLILTSRSDMQDVARGMALGANGYMSKPATVESLRAMLRQILGALPRKP